MTLLALLCLSGWTGCAIPDHIPQMAADGAGLGYSIAYMRALVQAVNSQPYEPIVNKFADYSTGSKL